MNYMSGAFSSSGRAVLFLLAALLAVSPGCAKKNTIWIYTSIYKEVIEAMKEPLRKSLPSGTQVLWFQGGSENIAGKVNAELTAGRTRADLILTSDPFWYLELKLAGKLLPYESPAARRVPPRYRDPDGCFAGVRLPVMVIGYNAKRFAGPGGPPGTWKELLDAKYRGLIAMPNPLESGSSFTAVALLSRTYGWDFFKELRKGNILAAGGNSSVINRIETGERPLGIVLYENIHKARERKSPVRAVFPADGAIPVVSPIAIMKDSGHPELAKLVYDWFFTDEAQGLMVATGMYSLIRAVPPPEGTVPFAELEKTMSPWSPEILQELYSLRMTVKTKFSEIVLH